MIRFLLLFALSVAAPQLLAQTAGKAPWEEVDKRVKASQAVSPLGPDLFGEQVSLSNGALSFTSTDLSLPGNSGLAVAFTRTYRVTDQYERATDGMLADWDVDLPSISGTFLPNWTDSQGGGNRCTDAYPKVPPGWGLLLSDFWNGHALNIPGVASGELLRTDAGAPAPTTGGPHPWMTNDQVHISCLPSIKNHTGQGFLAVTADGTKYWFDWMAQYAEPPLRRSTSFVGGPNAEFPLARRKNVLYATRVEDRFGNVVTYTYANAWNQPGKLTQISGSDGRQITVGYTAQNRINSVSDGTRTWTYGYASLGSGRTSLNAVTQPDGSAWSINFAAFTTAEIDYLRSTPPGEIIRTCTTPETPQNYAEEPVGTMTHPSGAVGQFTVSIQEHGRSNVPLACANVTTWVGYPPGTGNDKNDDVNHWPISYLAWTLKTKRISGPGMDPAQWDYSYVSGKSVHRYPGTTFNYPACTIGFENCMKPACVSDACAGSSKTMVQGPNSEWVRYTYGNSYRYNEGKLLKVEVGTGQADILQTTTHTYDLSRVDQPTYRARWGTGSQTNGDSFSTEYLRPLTRTVVTLQGTEFSRTHLSLDGFTRAVATESRTHVVDPLAPPIPDSVRREFVQYQDDLSNWVLGNVGKRWIGPEASTQATAREVESTDFNAQMLPVTLRSFGTVIQTLGFHTDGTIASATDGNQKTTTLTNWYRGLPRNIQFADGSARSATVTSLGWVTSVTDENGFTTSYGHDAMGRVNSVSYPAGDSVAWAPFSQSFSQVAATEYGIPAGHWRQSITQGNYRKDVYFDALWRPVISREYDATDVAGTQRFSGSRYDVQGRVTFAGVPLPSATGIASFVNGTSHAYDALGRLLLTSQSTEYGLPALTQTTYLTGFGIELTNPRGVRTQTYFQTFGEPSTDNPRLIIAAVGSAEQQTTTIARDYLGTTHTLTRAGQYGGSAMALSRQYVYDAQNRLCKRVEPETGATVLAYDGAGNLLWSAEGTALTGTTPGQCDQASVPVADRVQRAYDARNRLTLVDYPAGTADVATSYTPDGAVQSVTSGGVTTSYQYNKRRLLVSEQQDFAGTAWLVQYGYSALAHPASLTYPDGHAVSFAPNALGQATQAGPYATGASYHANGALKQFTYGNGIVHNLTQNARQLPERSRDALGATVILDDSYDYDFNGNVAGISDGLAGAPGQRSMTYDALDRLTGVTAGPLQGGNASFAYDPLDNLRVADQGTRQLRHVYDASNRLAELRDPGNALLASLGHDTRGNQTAKGPQAYTFDRANRLLATTAGNSSFAYDGLGRRVQAVAGGFTSRFFYGQAGQSLYTQEGKTGQFHAQVYLSGSLVARRSVPQGGGAALVTYQHTDALGSPVAETDASGTVVRRERMTAYGEPADGTWEDGPGFTGHEMDAVSGLVYMQQRYYDPVVGRFLSVDPLPSNPIAGQNFNRYSYAGNSPYRYVDPDGRQIRIPSSLPFDNGRMQEMGRCAIYNACLGDKGGDAEQNPVAATAEQRNALVSASYRQVRTGKDGIENSFQMNNSGDISGRTQDGCVGNDLCRVRRSEIAEGTTLIGHLHVEPAGSRLRIASRLSRAFVGPGDHNPLEHGYASGIIMVTGERYVITGTFADPKLEYLGGGNPSFGVHVQNSWRPGITEEEVKAAVTSFMEK